MAPRKAHKPAATPPAEVPEVEGVVTTPDAPEAPEEAPQEITVAFPLPVAPAYQDAEERPLLVRVDH